MDVKESITVANRAVRNCPWSGILWTLYANILVSDVGLWLCGWKRNSFMFLCLQEQLGALEEQVSGEFLTSSFCRQLKVVINWYHSNLPACVIQWIAFDIIWRLNHHFNGKVWFWTTETGLEHRWVNSMHLNTRGVGCLRTWLQAAIQSECFLTPDTSL